MKRNETIINQLSFCNELMNRMSNELKNDVHVNIRQYCEIVNRTRYQSDIIRLRRELMNLSKLLENGYMPNETE